MKSGREWIIFTWEETDELLPVVMKCATSLYSFKDKSKKVKMCHPTLMIVTLKENNRICFKGCLAW